MLKNRLMYAGALLGVLVFHTYYTGWFSWYLLILALTMPWFSLLCSLPAMLRLRLQAQMPSACTLGTQAAVRLGGGEPRLLAPPFRFTLVISDRMAGSDCRQKIQLSGAKTAQIELPSGHAGAYVCTLEKGSVFDYLGLFRFPLRLPDLGEFLVWPPKACPRELPELSPLTARAFRVKPAGGFAEIHDFRAYQPGDSMRDIHWKLSAKTDALIVREPLEPVRGQAVLSFDLAGSRETVDQTLGLLWWMSGWLLSKTLSHTVCWLNPETYEPESFAVETARDLQDLMERLLRSTLREGTPSIAAKNFPAADWRYHIRPESAEVLG